MGSGGGSGGGDGGGGDRAMRETQFARVARDVASGNREQKAYAKAFKQLDERDAKAEASAINVAGMSIPTTAGVIGGVIGRKTRQGIRQGLFAGGKPVFQDGVLVGVDEDGTYTGRAEASPYATQPTMEQQTRDEPVITPEIAEEAEEEVVSTDGTPTIVGRSKRRTRGKRSGLAGKTDEYGILVTT